METNHGSCLRGGYASAGTDLNSPIAIKLSFRLFLFFPFFPFFLLLLETPLVIPFACF